MRHFSAAGLTGAALATLAACASPGGSETDQSEKVLAQPVPYDANVVKDQRKVGQFIAEIDRSIRTWNQLVLDGNGPQDEHRVKLIEEAISHEARTRQETLIDQLATGPPYNRQVAAAALGFSDSPDALGPLLVALQDPEPQVVSNALLGLGLLNDRDTPLVGIATMMTEDDDPVVRGNAGRTLRILAASGVPADEFEPVRAASRRAVEDPEPAVRTHGLLLLAQLVDCEWVDRITLALDDEVALVARAASRTLASIGRADNKVMGSCARALASALVRVPEGSVRPAVLKDLQTLSRKNYGDDEEAWIEYANRLP